MLRSKSPHLLLALACGGLALAACETLEEEATDTFGDRFQATLLGSNEVPPVTTSATGRARILINDMENRICTDLEVRDIQGVTAAHIHEGRAGVNGPPVVTLDPPDDDDSDDCDTVADALIDRIRSDPTAFYVNVHTSRHPNGEIRGQVTEILD